MEETMAVKYGIVKSAAKWADDIYTDWLLAIPPTFYHYLKDPHIDRYSLHHQIEYFDILQDAKNAIEKHEHQRSVMGWSTYDEAIVEFEINDQNQVVKLLNLFEINSAQPKCTWDKYTFKPSDVSLEAIKAFNAQYQVHTAGATRKAYLPQLSARNRRPMDALDIDDLYSPQLPRARL
jgi:hypothetical protein